MDYDELRKIHRIEKSKKELQKLEDNFYKECVDLMNEYFEKYEKTKDVEYLKILENIQSIVKSILFLRQQKIVFSALRLAVADEYDTENMTPKEKDFFDKLYELIKENIVFIEEVSSGKFVEECEDSKDINKMKIKIILDIPKEFVGEDGNIYGPYKKGEIIEIDKKEGEFLIEKNLAELVR